MSGDRRRANRPESPGREPQQRSWANARRIADLADIGATGRTELVIAARDGDRAAIQQLCEISYRRVFLIAEACVRNRADAEDVAQQVMIKLIETLPTDRIDVDTFDGWLFTVARNQAFDHLRRARHAEPEAPEDIDHRRDGPDTSSPAGDRWRFDHRVTPVMGLLPARQQAVLLLHYAYDLTGEEIAEILDCSSAAVRQNHRRALSFLAQRLAVPGLYVAADLLGGF